ncbi:g2790 [Coccomyxa elongata]
MIVPNERTGRRDDLSTKGKPWKVVSRNQDDKWHLSKFRTASMEVTMTRSGDGTANETVQDAMQQRQVSVFEDVCGLPGRIYGRGGKAVECGVRGSMLVPIFDNGDMARAAPVAIMELVLLESKPFSYNMLLMWLHEKLPIINLHTSRDISHWYDENGKGITAQAQRVAQPPQEPQSQVDPPALLQPAVQPLAQALPATQLQPQGAVQPQAQARPQAALQEQQEVVAEPSNQAAPSPASAATAVAAPAAVGPQATDPARGRRGPKPSAAPTRQVKAPAAAGRSGRLTRAQRSTSVAAQKEPSSNGNPAAAIPCKLAAPEAPAEQQVPAAIIAIGPGCSAARPKRPRRGAAEDQPSGKERTNPRRSGRLLTDAAGDKIEESTGTQSRAAGKRPRAECRNASGRTLQRVDMSEVENQPPAVEEEPLQRSQVRRRCRPLADNTAEESNKSRNKVAPLSFGKVKQLFGSTLSEAAAKLGVPRSHLVRCCKENNMDGWPRLTISITDPYNAPASGLPSDAPASEVGGFQPCPCARHKEQFQRAPRSDGLLHQGQPLKTASCIIRRRRGWAKASDKADGRLHDHMTMAPADRIA